MPSVKVHFAKVNRAPSELCTCAQINVSDGAACVTELDHWRKALRVLVLGLVLKRMASLQLRSGHCQAMVIRLYIRRFRIGAVGPPCSRSVCMARCGWWLVWLNVGNDSMGPGDGCCPGRCCSTWTTRGAVASSTSSSSCAAARCWWWARRAGLRAAASTTPTPWSRPPAPPLLSSTPDACIGAASCTTGYRCACASARTLARFWKFFGCGSGCNETSVATAMRRRGLVLLVEVEGSADFPAASLYRCQTHDGLSGSNNSTHVSAVQGPKS